MELVITDNSVEKITVLYKDERFAILHKRPDAPLPKTIIFNLREAIELANFIYTKGGY